MAKWCCKGAILALMVGCVGWLAACDKKPTPQTDMNTTPQADTKTTNQTEVKDRLLGGKEVKQTQVTEQGDKTQVTETKTKLNPDGTLEKRETTVKGDPIK